MQLGPPLGPLGPIPSQLTQANTCPNLSTWLGFLSFLFLLCKRHSLIWENPKTKSPAHVPKRGAKSRRQQRNPSKLGHRDSLRVFCFSRSPSIAAVDVSRCGSVWLRSSIVSSAQVRETLPSPATFSISSLSWFFSLNSFFLGGYFFFCFSFSQPVEMHLCVKQRMQCNKGFCLLLQNLGPCLQEKKLI